MIIWGFRSRGKDLGQRPVTCPNCHRTAMTAFAERRRWFTLFFIPIFPVGGKQSIALCGLCGYRYAVEPAAVERLFGNPAGQVPAPPPPTA